MMLLKKSGHKYKYKWSKGGLKLLLVGTCFFISSCHHHRPERKTERSFYYWKSVFKLSGFEKNTANELQAKTIYLKFFDVDWNDEKQLPEPKAVIKIVDTNFVQDKQITIIPTVFITNECIRKIDIKQSTILAKKITDLIKDILSTYNIYNIPEIQIDCDWSVSTRDVYFSLLKSIKLNIADVVPNLSCTIRLHQLKFSVKEGVPPVDRGLLMCYNMGNLKDPSIENSILETSELKKYIGNLSAYPLQLDIAFPLFEWCVLFRDNQYKGLIENLDLGKANCIEEINRTMFFLLRDTIINGIQLKKDDIIRREQSNYEDIMSSAQLINEKLNTQHLRLSLFHLDSVILNKYPTDELENIYNSLH
jgi:hypothetical protein